MKRTVRAFGPAALLLLSAAGAATERREEAGPATPSATPRELCIALEGYGIPARSIALPTGGALVRKAQFVEGPGDGTAESGYCEVDGIIRPKNRISPDIRFSLALPGRWNGKALHLMGGGYDGVVVKGSGSFVGGEKLPTPVQRGYAAFGSDAGHDVAKPDWALDDEALENFAGDQLRKTRDAAVALIAHHYGRPPKRTYSAGGSGEGREALYVADRWPELYDGVIAFYPVWSAVGAFSGWIDSAQAIKADGAWSAPPKQRLVSEAVIRQCDGLDGLVDGMVGNVAACRFDPVALRCAAADSDDCLTDLQLRALVEGYGRSRKLPYALSHGIVSTQATNALNAGAIARMGTIPPGAPVASGMAFAASIADPFVRDFAARDPAVNVFNFAMNRPATAVRMRYLSKRLDVDPTLGRFIARGGKIIIVHGSVDQLHSADWSDYLYRRFVAFHGAATTTRQLRYYRVPGYDHGAGLPGAFQLSADLLSPLEDWVERDVAPAHLIARDVNPAHAGRTRPLCDFPAFPRYRGTGDPDAAENFICSPR